MPGISRRRFLRDASLGTAAVGALAVVGPSALGAVTAPGAAASPVARGLASHDLSAAASRRPGAEVMAHVADDSSGTISLYSGTRKVTFQDRALAEALLRTIQ
jgi:hypothetical protein